MIKKISKLQILRFITQVIFLIFLPDLFTLSFGQLKRIYLMALKGNFNVIEAWPHITAIFIILPLTVLLGRFFCGWFCTFGALNDFIYNISKKVFKTKFRVDEKLDSILKYVKFGVLLFIIVVIWTSATAVFNSFSPWAAFAQLDEVPQAISQYSVGFILLAFIAIGAACIERFFCRYLCPLGAVFSIFSKVRIFKIKKPRAECGKCRMCTNNCSMGINLYKMDKVNNGECINCFKCIDVCPRQNAQASICGENVNPLLPSAIAIATFAGAYSLSMSANTTATEAVGNTGNSSTSDTVSASNKNAEQKKYKDGTYTGVGTGKSPNLNVSVTIKNDKITNVEILSNTEMRGKEPFAVIPKEIMQSQSTNVDAVSGATLTSKGIMMAVNDALSKAKK